MREQRSITGVTGTRDPPYAGPVPEPPPLPARLRDMRTVVVVGSALWTAGALGLLLARIVAGRPLDLWFATCLAGAALGALGFGIVAWQRAAAKRGSRSAQSGLD